MKTALSSSLYTPPLANQSQWQQQLNASNSKAADITLLTKEGDKITIQSGVLEKSRQQMSSYESIERSLAQEVTVEKFSFTVEGDLNEQELADLTTLLDKLTTIADDFYTGDTNEAIAGAMAIGDMGTIARLEANFSQTTAISNYLKGPHPMPDMQDLLLDDVFASMQKNELNKEDMASKALQAQWQQFIDFLNKRDQQEHMAKTDQKNYESDENQKYISRSDRSHNRNKTAKQMFNEVEKTVTKNPRLTPLVTSVAEHAIDKAANNHEKNTHQELVTRRLKDQFGQEYSNWLI
nr:hypothetical protein [Desulfobulbaceae bacterium]